jgi:hypothetical protein
MIAVIARLKKFSLEEYNSSQPIVFIEARDPDGACYYATHRLTNILLKKDHSKVTGHEHHYQGLFQSIVRKNNG